MKFVSSRLLCCRACEIHHVALAASAERRQFWVTNNRRENGQADGIFVPQQTILDPIQGLNYGQKKSKLWTDYFLVVK